eukprot:365907-Chlamydomonas_euryale.AAC.31
MSRLAVAFENAVPWGCPPVAALLKAQGGRSCCCVAVAVKRCVTCSPIRDRAARSWLILPQSVWCRGFAAIPCAFLSSGHCPYAAGNVPMKRGTVPMKRALSL